MDGQQRWSLPLGGDSTPSFFDHVSAHHPQLLPFGQHLPEAAASQAPHGTTIVALTFAEGVLMMGDRRATLGSMIASRRIEKVFPADKHSVLGVAGTAGIALDMVRLFQVELEHYEKIEGTALSLEGKANRLGAMVRANLPAALQGLQVVPLFAGVEAGQSGGRLFSYDVTGGRYEELEHHSVGSGAVFARGALKKLWQPGLSATEAVTVALEAMFDAADDDSATGGPDLVRRLWPVTWRVTGDGAARVEQEELAAAVDATVARRLAAGRKA